MAESKRKTIVVNLLGGPGSGKTTSAWEIAAELNKLGYITEYVSEYAKELVWEERFEELNGSVDAQRKIYEEQKRRVDVLKGKVDFVVTDSPTLLSTLYLKDSTPEAEAFKDQVVADFKRNKNFTFMIQRSRRFEQAGRVHSEQESKTLDLKLRNILEKESIYHGTYTHNSIDRSIENMVKYHARNNPPYLVPYKGKELIGRASEEVKAIAAAEAWYEQTQQDQEFESCSALCCSLYAPGDYTSQVIYGVTHETPARRFDCYVSGTDVKVVLGEAGGQTVSPVDRRELQQAILNDLMPILRQDPWPLQVVNPDLARMIQIEKLDVMRSPEARASEQLKSANGEPVSTASRVKSRLEDHLASAESASKADNAHVGGEAPLDREGGVREDAR